jgi:hypothetical protein
VDCSHDFDNKGLLGKATYDILVFLGVVSDLGNRDSAACFFTLLILACRLRQRASQYAQRDSHTRVFQLHFHIEDGDDLALPLAHVHVAVHADHLVDLRGDAILLGRHLRELVVEEVPRPGCDIFVHPVPVVGVVQDHREREECVLDFLTKCVSFGTRTTSKQGVVRIENVRVETNLL